ncbi:PD-(D/E)XK motif protein [Turicibacter sanguinis]|uniref:PD-(D/E)XK motif protein n=1 Tax=Turicibacter sanguinis TaxID=154288 RepID=UPI0018AC201B|nr:PD-(D/E)XK motif protein [Turicibacter sanguinis]MDB8550981.1 PD-(D/E)XK motif protein [Turicibacter sanguinis]
MSDFTINSNEFIRNSDSELIDVYSGLDDFRRPAILVKLKKKPSIEIKTQVLETSINRRKDNMWALLISLTNNRLIGVFEKLSKDLINSIYGEENQLIAERKLIQRYNEWQCLFEEEVSKKLNFNRIQGLLGELYFLNNVLIPKQGIKKAITSWIGPSGGNKDFQLENIWFEVKAKSTNKDIVHISNKNQLLSEQVGYLTIVDCEKTSSEVPNSINLMILYEEIYNQIDNETILIEFMRKLANLNFIPSEYYTQFNFLVQKVTFYEVNDKFPVISLPSLENAVCNLRYDLFLPALTNYIKEEIEWNY